MRLKATRLPLNDVADYWAREAALLLDGLSLQAIRSNLFMSLRDDDMAIAQPLREEAPKGLGIPHFLWVHTDTWGYPLPITGDLLEKVMVSVPGATTESRDLDDYNEVSRKVWFEEVTVGQEGFGFWCDDNGHERPEFWFGKPAGLDQEARAKGGTAKKYSRPFQDIVNHFRAEIGGKKITLKKFLDALREQIAESKSKTLPEEFSLLGCDNLYVDSSGAVTWDGVSKSGSLDMGSIQPYLDRANTKA